MAIVLPYPKLSSYQSETATELITKKDQIIQTFFPLAAYNGYDTSKVAAFFITTSSGSKTLVLADALAFVNLINSGDPLRELLPVIFDCSPRNCSIELIQAIRDCGQTIGSSPRLVAFQIEPDARCSFSKLLFPSYYGDDPHAVLAGIIREDMDEGYIGDYRIRKIPDGWRPPVGNPAWQGAAFEQEDRLIRTWIHEANPNALQRARTEAQQSIDQANAELARKDGVIQRHRDAGRYHGQLQERLDRERDDINNTLQERQNRLAYLTAQTVNSAAQTTFQCAIRIQVDVEEKIQFLERYVCQQIVTIIDRSLDQVNWQKLQIGMGAIENFIRQKINALEEKLPTLVENNDHLITDWEHFRNDVFPTQQAWARQTFGDFCQEKIGRANPSLEKRPELQRQWQESLSEKLKWVTSQLRAADDQLKIVEHFGFTDFDIRIFNEHRERMVKVLRRSGEMTYGLSEELQKRYRERDLIRSANPEQGVHLVKRITTGGHVYFGVTNPPGDPSYRSDPNDCLNEVHVPVINVPNPIRIAVHNHPIRRNPPQHRKWKWVVAGALVLLGTLMVRRYFKGRTPSKTELECSNSK